MNLYEATIGGTATQPISSVGSQQLSPPAALGPQLQSLAGHSGAKVIVGVRAEHLVIPTSGSPTVDRQRLVADVELVEALGNEQLVHFAPVHSGERIEFAVEVERLHFFDSETGTALARAAT